jgi:hypothetical protein
VSSATESPDGCCFAIAFECREEPSDRETAIVVELATAAFDKAGVVWVEMEVLLEGCAAGDAAAGAGC